MASLDFEKEKSEFREFYSSNIRLLEDANKSFVSLINALVNHAGNIPTSKIEGRVKDKEECIRKFNRKYRISLEEENVAYSIKDHISDLIGLRIVCLYEDDIDKIKSVLSKHFEVIDITDKISKIENTEGEFGYKGLHLDLRIADNRKNLPEYDAYSNFNFEVQIRTIIQDSWSVLDHKIKYKKSIPNRLKRRINTLAALFELADREFKEIRNATEDEIKKEELESPDVVEEQEAIVGPMRPDEASLKSSLLNAFAFLKIAKHFFNTFEFEAHKVDGFTQEIVSIKPDMTRGKFNFYMRENISQVKKYKAELEAETSKEMINPYTAIRHCLYIGDKDLFKNILNNDAREAIDNWLSKQDS